MAIASGINLSSVTENSIQRNRTESVAVSAGSSFRDALRAAGGSLESIFDTASRTYGVSKKLLMAVAKQESNFDPNAVSHAGAKGIMQLMPETARGLGVRDVFDPYESIMGGAKLLRDNLKKFGSVPLALAAYNAGAGAVQKYNGIPPYRETQNYVSSIMKMLGDSSLHIESSYRYGGGSGTSSYGAAGLPLSASLDGMGLAALLGSGRSSFFGGLGGIAAGGIGGATAGALGGDQLMQLLLGQRSAEREAAAGDGASDTVTLRRDSFRNLVALLRIQMMMRGGSIGSMGEI